ncbi:MAG: hypothetical protein IJS45_03370 [Clostridia bacterium]|nr:hypothetical protein [Clostridia bacterium]
MDLNDLVCPAPFAVKDGCLGYMKSEKRGEQYFVRLCNFVPFIASQLIVDDGAETKVRVEIGGFDSLGHTLQTITVPDEKFNSLEWVRNNWGYEFNLETGQTVKDRIRYFLQSTAEHADKKKVYAATGWKRINGQWEFLMPDDEKHTVRLEGRSNNYGFLRNEDPDAVIKAFTLPYAIAPRNVMMPLTAFAFLSPLNSFLKKAQCEPKTILLLCGKTGSKKSTLAALTCSFFGRFSTTELPLSFRDTANSIIRQSFALKDVLTVIDDYHPSNGKDAAQMNASAQMIFRAYGNRVGRGRLNANSELMTDRYPQGNAIITAEFLPDVGESGTARFITLDLGRDDVNNEELSHYQQLAADGILSAMMFQYTEWIKEKYLTGEKAEEEFVRTICSFCKHLRSLLAEKAKEKKIDLRDRLLDDLVSLRIGYEFYCDFLMDKQCILPEGKAGMIDDFDNAIFSVAAEQQSRTEQEQPTHKFLRKLKSLIDSGAVGIAKKEISEDYPTLDPPRLIGYADDDTYYLDKTLAHRAVKKLCDDQGEGFAISENGLAKALLSEGISEGDTEGNTTKTVRIGKRNRRLLVISKAKIEEIINADK